MPLLMRDRKRQPRPPGRDIRVVETCIQAAADSAPVRERHAGDVSAQIERRRKRRGRITRQAEAVMDRIRFQDEIRRARARAVRRRAARRAR